MIVLASLLTMALAADTKMMMFSLRKYKQAIFQRVDKEKQYTIGVGLGVGATVEPGGAGVGAGLDMKYIYFNLKTIL